MGLTVLIFAGIMFGLFNASYGAKIIIIPEPEEIDINFNIQIKQEAAADQNNILSGHILETIQEAQQINTAQATVSMEDYAEGEIILTNNTWQNINFVASTRFASPEGLIFRAINKIRIPSKGQAGVLVRADQMGQAYDIEPTEFSIPNLRDPYLKNNIESISEKPMTGGLKKTGIVMQSDIDKAQKELQEKLYAKGISELEKQLPESDLKIVIKSEVIEQSSDANAGDEKAEFNTLVKLKIGAVGFNEKKLLDLAVATLKQQTPEGKNLSAFEPNSLSYRLLDYNLAETQANLEVQFRGYMTINANHQILEKIHFRDLSLNEVKNYLAGFKEIRESQIRLWPPLILKKTPQNIDKIEISIKKLK